jgi:DNA-directed RNA polymerase specialized sigma24 family protein
VQIGERLADVTDEGASWDRPATLYRAEQPGLVRLATLLVRDQAVAEELVQEAFVRLHPKVATVERPGAYLRTIVVNLCRGHGRRLGTAAAHRPEPVAATAAPGLPADLSPVWLALGGLPDRQRHALVLRFYLDLPDDEIAQLLDARPGTVRSLISRGLAALKEVVEP